MKKRVLVVLAVLTLVLAACGSGSAPSVSQEQSLVNQQQSIYNTAQPVHIYDYSLQRQVLQDIYDNMNQNSNTWDVVTSYSGAFLWECPAVGWPIPADAELTNPSQLVNNSATGGNWGYGVVGQAEPNGIYTGATQGTYIVCLRNGKDVPVYTENNVQMFPFPVKWDTATNSIVDAGGNSTISVTIKTGNVTGTPASPAP